jgi:hypothetical protein
MRVCRTRGRGLHGWAAALGLLLAVGLGGCDPGTPPVEGSTEEAVVKGTVKARGTPLVGGQINFNAVNSKRRIGPRTAPIGKDGSYTVKTLVGPNIVTVLSAKFASKSRKNQVSGLEYDEKTVTVAPGEQTIDLDFNP